MGVASPQGMPCNHAPFGAVDHGGVRLGCGFRQPNSETEFGASVIGIGPYALRGGRGTARRVVVPYGWLRRAAAIALGSGAQRSACGGGGEGGVGIGVKSIPKGGKPATIAGGALSEAGTFASAASGGKSEQKGVAAVKIL